MKKFTFVCVMLLSTYASISNAATGTSWSANGPAEVVSFYQSNLSIDEYFDSRKSSLIPVYQQTNLPNSFQFCWALIEFHDYTSATACLEAFKKISSEHLESALSNTSRSIFLNQEQRIKAYHQFHYVRQAELLEVRLQMFKLEQGRFNEVIDTLLPIFSLEAKVNDLSSEQKYRHAYNLQAAATASLISAYRALGQQPPEAAFKHLNSPDFLFTANASRVLDGGRSAKLMQANRENLLGNHEACAKIMDGEASKTAAAIETGGNKFLDIFYSNSGTAIKAHTDREVLKLEGHCAFSANRFDQAELAYLELLKADQKTPLPAPMLRVANWRLGLIARQKGDLDSARKFFSVAVEHLESERSSLDTESLRMGFLEDKKQLYTDMVEVLIKTGHAGLALEYADRGKSRTLIEVLALRQLTNTPQTNGEFSRQQRLHLTDLAIRATEGKAANSTTPTNQQNRTSSTRIRNAQALLQVEPVSISDVQKKLGAQEVLLMYFGDEQRLFLFRVDKDSVKALRIDGHAAFKAARAFSETVKNPTSKDYKEKGRELYEAILKNADIHHSKIDTLTIIPHSDLHYVPFAALTVDEQFLIQKKTIQVLPSASALLFERPQASAGSSALLFGNPDLGDPNLLLPGAENEVNKISELLTKPVIKTRERATESEFVRLASNAKVIHLAMHGKFDSSNPLTSGLYMTKDDLNDGVLTTAELYDLEIGADLIVMSACETGISDFSKGDDLVGLTRGFFLAGAGAIVATLWEIDDKATTDLMIDFYKKMKTLDYANSLRTAQTNMLKSRAHPYYWSAFQYYGHGKNQ